MMGYVKNKYRNRMNEQTMEMMAQIKLMLFDDPVMKYFQYLFKKSKQNHLDKEGGGERVQSVVGDSGERVQDKDFNIWCRILTPLINFFGVSQFIQISFHQCSPARFMD
jgi:hypothetical protein